MSPDDPRHGTEAGATQHYRDRESACNDCREAHRRRNVMRALYPHKRPALGTQRRVQALQAIGYGRQRIAEEVGWTDAGALTYLMKADTLLAATAERIADAYERLYMTVPEGVGPKRARTWAKRNGYAPPLAWDDIDNDLEPTTANVETGSLDEVVVERLLLGEQVPSTRAEKLEAMRRWRAFGKSEKSLCDRHGWKAGRYVEREEGAA